MFHFMRTNLRLYLVDGQFRGDAALANVGH
jgi:hypothetical protein